MKKTILLLIITFLSLNTYAQINFEKGYIIDDSGQRQDGFIKNIDWRNNPEQIDFKTTENSIAETLGPDEVREFGIDNTSKYIRANVEIDRSESRLDNLSKIRNPEFKNERLFLKVLIEGQASLYNYEDGLLKRYFYSVNDSDIDQLIYKKYKISASRVGTNNGFHHQLFTHLKFPGYSIRNIENINYNKKQLLKYFIEYNKAKTSDYTNYETKVKRDPFNFTLRPGMRYSKLEMRNRTGETLVFDNQINFSFGLETEFILPFNNDKWAVIFEPTYQYFNSESEDDPDLSYEYRGKVEYQSVELPLGVRHYLFLNQDSKIFINASFIIDFNFNSSFKTLRAGNEYVGEGLELKSQDNLGFGAGYKFKDTYSVELRYQTSRDLLSDYVFYSSDYNSVSLLFGYSFF